MAISVNRVFLGGNLTRDPEVRYIPSGMAVAEFGLAINEHVKDSTTNEWKEKPVFVDIVVWDRQAQACGEYLKKGSPVVVEGRLQLDQWKTPQGDKRSKLRVRADRVNFLGAGNAGDRPRVGGEGAQQGAPANHAVPPSSSESGGVPPAFAGGDPENLPF